MWSFSLVRSLLLLFVVWKIFLGDGFLCMWLEGVIISIAENELARLLISVTGISSVMEYERRGSLSYIMYRRRENFALKVHNSLDLNNRPPLRTRARLISKHSPTICVSEFPSAEG